MMSTQKQQVSVIQYSYPAGCNHVIGRVVPASRVVNYDGMVYRAFTHPVHGLSIDIDKPLRYQAAILNPINAR